MNMEIIGVKKRKRNVKHKESESTHIEEENRDFLAEKDRDSKESDWKRENEKQYGEYTGNTKAKGISNRVPALGSKAKLEILVILALTLLAGFTRLYKIGKRGQVTWDESHFGKFGAYYLNRTFYHDVHPPLAKMLVGLAEYVAGHNGTFAFKGVYPEYVNYVAMRVQLALYGIALVPIAYWTLRRLTNGNVWYSALGATFVALDNAICVMSRFILLDEPLLFFTAISIACAVETRQYRAFEKWWWAWMFATGVGLGCAVSSKWVGLFCIAVVGIDTVEELYELLERERDVKKYAKHWGARAICLIMVPVMIYFAAFFVHFKILNKSGPGNSVMPVEFQAGLEGSELQIQAVLNAYGSHVRMRLGEGGYLHSHVSKYPGGKNRQQVTIYGHADGNNVWQLLTAKGKVGMEYGYIEDGNEVVLRHNATGRLLYSDGKAPSAINGKHILVYGNTKEQVDNGTEEKKEGKGKGKGNEIFVVRWEQETGRSPQGKRIRTITTKFRLQHRNSGKYLGVSNEKYPSWGFNQGEVVLLKSGESSKNRRVVIERSWNDKIPETKIEPRRSSFLRNFLYLNQRMASSNNALIPDRDKYNHLESNPITWPFMIYPMRMNGRWDAREIKYYEIGNPIIWWLSTLACLLYPAYLAILYIAAVRAPITSRDASMANFTRVYTSTRILWTGWLLHYAPFFIMGRVTYLHHYLPSAYFALLLLAAVLYNLCIPQSKTFIERSKSNSGSNSNGWKGRLVGSLVLLLCISGFLLFSPLTFGYQQDIRNLKHRQWLKTWNIYIDGNDLK